MKTRWKSLPEAQRQGIVFIESLFIYTNIILRHTKLHCWHCCEIVFGRDFNAEGEVLHEQAQFGFGTGATLNNILSDLTQLPADIEARMAPQLAGFHSRACRVIKDKPFTL